MGRGRSCSGRGADPCLPCTTLPVPRQRCPVPESCRTPRPGSLCPASLGRTGRAMPRIG
ncbi:hypothetical protein PIB30_116208, partial [Stylosanthes scabra]|nr:hypothetical protein [Stylosanthes scabra]